MAISLNKELKLSNSPMDANNTITIKTHWIIKAIAVWGLVIAVISLYNWIVDPQSDNWKGFLLFVFLGCLLWILAGSYIQMSNQYILVQAPYGRFRISWDEVKHIQTNGKLLAFIGENKRIVITTSYMNSSKSEMYKLMNLLIEERNIPIKRTIFIPQTHKNARVKSSNNN